MFTDSLYSCTLCRSKKSVILKLILYRLEYAQVSNRFWLASFLLGLPHEAHEFFFCRIGPILLCRMYASTTKACHILIILLRSSCNAIICALWRVSFSFLTLHGNRSNPLIRSKVCCQVNITVCVTEASIRFCCAS